ncbi:MAG: radical protein [Deltaproteobacteria bacterium]|nr:radical protein [Deltaproteobacteria bacterium]
MRCPLRLTCDLARYGVDRDERCSQCMMDCGFAPSVGNEVSRNWRDMVGMAPWNVT